MTDTNHTTTLPGANRHVICEIAEEWRHQLDLAGPFGGDDALQQILAQTPDCCAEDAEIVRGWLDGRRGYRAPQRANAPFYMCGFWSAVGRNFQEKHGPEKKAPLNATAAAFFHVHR